MIFEYVWLDGAEPLPNLRSKIRVSSSSKPSMWTFDGSSTYQAKTEESDLLLKPVRVYNNPFMKGKLVLCEVLNPDKIPHQSNKRRRLIEVCEHLKGKGPLVGFEQEYLLYEDRQPPKINAYCGVGLDRIKGRDIAERHLAACIKAGIKISGMNAEVVPAQWEYQIGPANPVRAADDLWMSRYILYKICEEKGVEVSFEPKPIHDRHGSGCHINLSFKKTRNAAFGKAIGELIKKLGDNHNYLLPHYGPGNEKRLTGDLEASDYNKFTWGIMDRTASVRIPISTYKGKAGYIEDRRPGANIDPYVALCAILECLMW